MLVPVDQLIGQVFGSYQLESLLGSGSLSSVFAASNTVFTQSSGRPRSVMVTVFTLPVACEGRARERFMTRFWEEAQHLVHLNHPNIVPVYDFGEQFGYPYLVTPLTEGNSLSTLLKQKASTGRCPFTPEQTLAMLQQMALAFDYAHQNGYVHGSLKLANLLLVGDQSHRQIHIAGFGLVRLLEMRGIGRVDHRYPHLFSVAGTMVVNTTYLAPEVIEGQAIDARADVYALGIIIFELLSGRPPFIGDDPFAVAQQQLEARLPSLQEVCPEASAELVALDLVLQRALERNPAYRFSSVGKLASAFKRALNVLKEAEHSTELPVQPKNQEFTQLTRPNPLNPSNSTAPIPVVPPTIVASNWLVSSSPAEDAWMGITGTTSAKLPALGRGNDKSVPLVASILPGETGTLRGIPLFSSQFASVRSASSSSHSSQVQSQQLPQQIESVDTGTVKFAPTVHATGNGNGMSTRLQSENPFANSTPLSLPMPQAGQKHSNSRRNKSKVPKNSRVSQAQDAKDKPVNGPQLITQEKKKSPRKTRRAVLLTSGIVVAGVLGFGGFDLLNGLRAQGQPSANEADMIEKAGRTSVAHPSIPQKSAMNTGMLLGNKNTPLNTAKDFINPVDQKASILVRLPSGTFVAYEKACTHQGVPVNYDPATQKLVCPLHHSVFDPANKAAVVNGPATTPLAPVALQILPDGSVIIS